MLLNQHVKWLKEKTKHKLNKKKHLTEIIHQNYYYYIRLMAFFPGQPG